MIQTRERERERERVNLLIVLQYVFGSILIDFNSIANISTGSSNASDAVDNGQYPLFIRSKEIKRIDQYEYDEEAIIIPGEGGVGDIIHYINGKYALHQRVYRINFINKNLINTRYAKYYLECYFKKYILKKAVSATVTSIRKPMIEEFEINLPILSIQNKIVDVLDNFEQLCSNLNIGLPKETGLRNKQYEYYRDQIFNYLNKGKLDIDERERERETRSN
ncbi:restriction endonuclease subunit S [Mycoplasma tullyi]|uniref:Restriction endonuclease subunit S n=1 Tax=Mycoplasma tullyi TaxID=1612150 RepID=A0A7D7U2M2_9MOLU|nr:restriction endonuclease subunit S [Mycoplasma tullyi]QMT98311.1 restriction endonuclease subunit S [Mycoplasma tullyi]